MPEETDQTYDQARDLAEAALEKYVDGDPAEGDKLAEKAVSTDRHAVEDLVEEMDEDAASTDGAK